METSSAILNAQLIFDSYFAWTCFGTSSIFTYSKKFQEIHLKLEELENQIEQLDIDIKKISDQMNVKIQDLETLEHQIEQRVKERR